MCLRTVLQTNKTSDSIWKKIEEAIKLLSLKVTSLNSIKKNPLCCKISCEKATDARCINIWVRTKRENKYFLIIYWLNKLSFIVFLDSAMTVQSLLNALSVHVPWQEKVLKWCASSLVGCTSVVFPVTFAVCFNLEWRLSITDFKICIHGSFHHFVLALKKKSFLNGILSTPRPSCSV